MDWLTKIKSGVPKIWLQLLAGLMWTGVGILLVSLAWGWIFAPDVSSRWMYWISGTLLAFFIYQFGFSKLAKKNSKRIEAIAVEQPCLFAFQEWHSYPLILFMVTLGITLRKFTPIPKPLLGILYFGIGGGLGTASFHYYKSIWRSLRSKNDIRTSYQ